MYYNTTGNNNTAVGYNAALNNNGVDNVVIGRGAMQTATGVNNSVAIGYEAMYSHSGTGDEHNVYIGYQAGKDGTSAYANVIVGGLAGENVTTCNNSTFVGKSAGSTVTTGSHNVCIGRDSQPSSATSSNQFTLGDNNIDNLRCNDTSISSLSDRRDKTDIVDLPVGLDFVNTLQPRKFKWQTRDGNIKDGSIRAGFIAQELQEAQKDCNYMQLVLESNPEKLEANEGHLIPVLVQAIKDLSAENTALKARLDAAGL